MIILDTMVVLEPFRRTANAIVLDWLDRQDAGELWLTAITAAELQAGVELQAQGPRREIMQREVSTILEDDFAGRVLPFDLQAARFYAEIAGRRERESRRLNAFDFQIAGIAKARGAVVATRNVRDFADCGVELIDPWAG